MSKKLYLKQLFEVNSIEASKETDDNYEFNDNENGFDIEIVVSGEVKQIEAETTLLITKELYEEIYNHLIINALCVEGRQERIDMGIKNAQKSLIQAIQKTVNIMEFVTGYLFLNTDLVQGNCYCSIDNQQWEDVNKRHLTSSITACWNVETGLNACEEKVIQNHIDKKVEPFLAIHHLIKATKETDLRHQLINLAIALELGIKEYLVRKKTDIEIEALIKNIQAPPTHKLYGEILECFLGEKTPVRMRIIQDMATDRNNIVHSVIGIGNGNQNSHKINDYFAATKIALYHLWLDLYPYDLSVKKKYKWLLNNNLSVVRKDYICTL